ncbi:MAG: GNAT family N-acetyltransferase [Caldithrix sp.]|nr:GNAT family N-acetyltransferase [Caldithrix sp.]
MKNLQINLRKATIDDAKTIASYNRNMAKETEELELDEENALKGVQSLFKHPDYGFYAVAEIEDDIVGSLMVTKEWTDWRNGEFWWIQSVYIRSDYRRLGIYRKLYEFVKSLADENAIVRGFRLYVHRENYIARKTYHALGMKKTPYRIFEEIR